MNILKIKNGKGEFLNSKGEYVNIIDISKDDIYYLSDIILKNDVEIDVEDEETNSILNEAEKIIYENIRIELTKIETGKETLLSEIETLFKDAKEKYKNDLLEEDNVPKVEMAEEKFESASIN